MRTSDKKTQRNLEIGSVVYFTAFPKQQRNIFYICKGIIKKLPEGDRLKNYQIKIIAIADRPWGGQPDTTQRSLLGRIINKRKRELSFRLGTLMEPRQWLE